jgi:pectate lyase C
MKSLRIALAGIAVALSFSAFAANRPTGYVTICTEGKTCSVSTSTKVAFGRADKFFYKVLSGSFACTSAAFGGRVAGGTNECSVPKKGSQPPLPPGTPPASITGATCVSTGNVIVTSPIIIPAGTTYDGACKTYVGNGLDNGESPQPVFRIEAGGTLKNAIIGVAYTAGVHIYGGGTVDNVSWLDVFETGLTVKSSGTVIVRNITATKGNDRFLQINAASTVKVTNCVLDEITQTLVRQNGGTVFKTDVTFDSCRIAGPTVSIFRTDSNVSTAQLLNSYVRMSGRVCYGSWASCTYTNSFSY